MDVFFVVPELSPFRAGSFVAETAAAASKAIRQLGHKVTVVAPLWADVDPQARHLARRLQRTEVALGDETIGFALYEGRSAAGVDLAMLGHEGLFPRDVAAGDAAPAASRRWGAFLRGVLALLARRETRPDVVHVFGWQTAPLALLLREDERHAHVPCVLSLDDPHAHGLFDRAALADYGMSARHFGIEGVEFYGRVSALKAGVQLASAVVVPGPSFARAIVEPGGAAARGGPPGAGLEGALKNRGRALVGIVPGVDASVWNAATDPHLAVRFDAVDLKKTGPSDKARCKASLQQELGLPVRDDVLLVGCVVSETEGSGLETLAGTLGAIARNDVQVAIAIEGPGGPIRERIAALAAPFSDRVCVRTNADAELVHRVIGSADALAVPASLDPTAVRPMQAHRYGTLPIVQRHGLAIDTVVDCDAQLRSGNGFLFDGGGDEHFLGGVQRAIAAYADRAAFRAAQARAIAADHGWERAARLYERLYRSLESAHTPALAPPA